jgi:RNA polymerase sigma-70 factor (ECF subfamily)
VKGFRERALVRRILAGDRAAGERLVGDHYPLIYRLLLCLAGSAEIAEDLTQQTFVKAWQALASFRGESSLATWLHSIGYREYTHWLRSRRDDAPLHDSEAQPGEQFESRLESMLLRRALAQLSAEHRETFLLYHLQELSVKEVAAVLNVPSGTVKSRLVAARRRLRELLRKPVVAPSTGAKERGREVPGRRGSDIPCLWHPVGNANGIPEGLGRATPSQRDRDPGPSGTP